MSESSIPGKQTFKELLHSICKNITDDDLDSMKFLLGDNLTERDKDSIKCPKDLIFLMENSGILSVDKRGLLSDLLRTINRPALAQELDNFNGRSLAIQTTASTKLDEFQRVLFQIGQTMVEADVQNMKFLLEDKICEADLEKAKTSFQVISTIQQKGHLSKENPQTLMSILLELKNMKSITLLRPFINFSNMAKAIPYNVEKSMIKKHFKKDTETARKLATLMSKHQLVTMTGFLGLGKSQNALYFGCCHKEKYTDALVWRCNATDKDAFHSSLKQLTDTLQISSQIIETTPTDDAIAILQDLISKELMKRATNGYHLLIIDGVSLECREVIEQFVRCFLESEQSNTKIITTTNVQYLLHDEQQLRVQGFTENESIAFLSDGHAITEQKRNDYRSLATKLGHNPLGLYLFKSYMQRYLISPKSLIGFIGKREDIEMIEIDCKQSNLNFADKALFSALEFQIFTYLKNSVDPHIFQMFQMLQFLSIDDVPLLLFDFLPHGSSRSSSLITNAFVNALQTNSFGDLGGEDETRFITIHSSISLTLDMHTAQDEKSELLKQLVWALNLLLNKDVFLYRDLIRQQMMLPHLRSVLKHTEKRLSSANLENQMLLIFLNDLTGYAHNFGGLRKIAGEFSEKAKQLCLEVLNESEEEINQKISKEIGCSLEKGHIRGKETMSVFKRFTSRKANYIYKKLRGIAELQKDVLKDFVPKFISTRYRVPDNIRLIEEFLGETASTLRLSDEEYNSLVEKEMAVPYEVMEKTFLPELFMAVFYTYGRRLFYIDAMKEKALAKIFIEYLFIAKELGQYMISENPNFRPLDTLLSERTGTLETYFVDHNIFEMEHDTCLEDAAKRFEEMFQDTNRYYVFGVIKMKAVDDDIHKTICLKQLLRCFTKMINMESDEKNQRQIYDKGCEHAEHILQLSDDARLKERRNLPGIQVGVADFYMAFKDAPKHILQKAEKLLLTVCPKYLIDKAEKRDIIPQIIRHENTAALGLLKCYIRSNEKEKANNLLMELQPYIAAYGSKKDQTTLSELEEENGLMDQNRE